jgi:hypothetical protein
MAQSMPHEVLDAMDHDELELKGYHSKCYRGLRARGDDLLRHIDQGFASKQSSLETAEEDEVPVLSEEPGKRTKAWDMHRAWQETLEGLKRVVSSLGRYNWINQGKMVASGRADIRPFGYREGTETVKVVEMFKAVEAVAYNYGWSINFLTQTILSGATLTNGGKSASLTNGQGASGQVGGG